MADKFEDYRSAFPSLVDARTDADNAWREQTAEVRAHYRVTDLDSRHEATSDEFEATDDSWEGFLIERAAAVAAWWSDDDGSGGGEGMVERFVDWVGHADPQGDSTDETGSIAERITARTTPRPARRWSTDWGRRPPPSPER